MTKTLQRLCVAFLVCLCAAPVLADPVYEGTWIGAFAGRRDWVFVRVVLGGTGSAMAGRVDLPVQGEYGMALHRVSAAGTRVSFEIPGAAGNLLFDGKLRDDTIRGTVTQGFGQSTFELVRQLPSPEREFVQVQGHYAKPGELPILVYYGPQGPAYVDYTTGRMGSLFRTADDTYISGSTMLAGYPVDVTMTFERNSSGAVTSLKRSSKSGTAILVRQAPYRVEDVRFQSPGSNLGGWLLVPNTPGPHPAIVMIHGSGPSTRQSLLPFADVFVRNGIAVLVHDKRGSGQSTGSYARATFDDLAQDALAGVALLKQHPDIDGQHIGLLGASLGGWVAPHAASMSKDVKFVIVEAAPATTPAEHERERVQRQMRADGVDLDVIAKARAYMDQKFEVGRTGKGWDELMAVTARAEREGWAQYVNTPSSLDLLQWNWTHIMSWDPRPALERLTIPVLALYGELDTIVSPEVHLQRLKAALTSHGNKDVTVKVLPGANHHFFAASTGGPAETRQLSQFVPGYFETRVAWVRERVDVSASLR